MGLRLVAIVFLYTCAALPSCLGDAEELPVLMPVTSQALSDSPTLGDEGVSSDSVYTMDDLVREEKALEDEEMNFKEIRERLSKRLSDHTTEKSEFEKHKSETEERLKSEEYGEEEDDSLEEEELKKLEEKLDSKEREIQGEEEALNVERYRIRDAAKDLKGKEEQLRADFSMLRTMQRELEDEFIRAERTEQGKHGECVDAPEALKRLLKESQRNGAKICNPTQQSDDVHNRSGEED